MYVKRAIPLAGARSASCNGCASTCTISWQHWSINAHGRHLKNIRIFIVNKI